MDDGRKPSPVRAKIDGVHPVDVLRRFGGVASSAQLMRFVDRGQVERSLLSGEVVRDARGAYALPTAPVALRVAAAHAGVVSHASAAAAWGWEMKRAPALPHLIVPRNRNVDAEQRTTFVPHWSHLRADEVRGRVTSPERTLVDCLTTMPPDEAQCVADSALRHRAVDHHTLRELAESSTNRGSGQARRIADLADGRAANPFESTLRWIAHEVRGLDVEPQVCIREQGYFAQPDLVDRRRRIVLEADSATWHTSRQALRRDCHRYNRLTLLGWLVLRFVWEDVMFDAASVRADLRAAVAGRGPERQRRRSAA